METHVKLIILVIKQVTVFWDYNWSIPNKQILILNTFKWYIHVHFCLTFLALM